MSENSPTLNYEASPSVELNDSTVDLFLSFNNIQRCLAVYSGGEFFD